MIRSLSIWQDNRITFGGGKKPWTNKRVATYYFALIILAGFTSFAVGRPSDSALNAILTSVAIIAGFTFNALMFLVDGKFLIITDPNILEQASRQKKIDRLTKSSFSIIYYFNILAIFIIVSCVVGLFGPGIGKKLPFFSYSLLGVIEFFGRSILFAFLFEATISFFRALRRLRYLFMKVRGLE